MSCQCPVSFVSTGGQIFSWGQNRYGQLGLGTNGQSVSTPQMVQSLQGVPFAQISAGGAHSFALTLSGAVFGWGCNKFGQLGQNDINGKSPGWPRALNNLEQHSYIGAVADYSVVENYEKCSVTVPTWFILFFLLLRPVFPNVAQVPAIPESDSHLLWRGSHSSADKVKLYTCICGVLLMVVCVRLQSRTCIVLLLLTAQIQSRAGRKGSGVL